MNPDFRKVALIAASLGLLISLFFALRDDDEDSAAQTTTAQTTTAQTTTEAPPTTSEQVTTEAPPPTTTAGSRDRRDQLRGRRRPAAGRDRPRLGRTRPERGHHRHLRRRRGGASARVRPERGRRAQGHRRRSASPPTHPAGSRSSSRTAAFRSPSSRFAPEPARPRDRRRQGPAGSGVALLLGRRRRPRPLVPRARCALEAAAARAARRGASAPRGARARPPVDRSPSGRRRRLRRPARARLPDRADRRAVLGPEPRADVHLHPVLARASCSSRCCSGTSGACSTRGSRSRTASRGCGGGWARSGRRRSTTHSGSASGPVRVALALFAALELAYSEPASPRALALAVALYSYAMWFGMAAFGRRAWDDHGNGFTVYFGLLARIAPFGEHDGRLVLRVPFSGLAGAERMPGMLAFVAVMLGSVGFDGLSRAPFWQNLVRRPRRAVHRRRAAHGRAAHDRAGARRPSRLHPGRRTCLPRRREDRGADGPVRAAARARVPAEPRPDRARLRRRALLHGVRHHRPVHLLARVRPVRVRLGPLRHGHLLAEHRTVPAQHRLVRPGRLARRRARGRPGGRARSCGLDPAGAGRAPLPVRHAGADGALHGRWAVALVAAASDARRPWRHRRCDRRGSARDLDRGHLPRGLPAGAARRPLPR